MTDFTTEEINLICLYDSNSRRGVIKNLRTMLRYLTPDEPDLKTLALGAIAKLKRISDEEFERNNSEWMFGWLPDDFMQDNTFDEDTDGLD